MNQPTLPAQPSATVPHAPRQRKGRPHRNDSGDALLQEPYNPVQREQALWRAVIMQMFTDALSNSRKYEALQHKREAEIWLRGTSRDFRTVCDYAGYDPSYIRQMARRLLAHHDTPARQPHDA